MFDIIKLTLNVLECLTLYHCTCVYEFVILILNFIRLKNIDVYVRDFLVDALGMKGGTGDHSYATNSHYQVLIQSMMNCDDIIATYYFDSHFFVKLIYS